jgi:hypothetical protein
MRLMIRLISLAGLVAALAVSAVPMFRPDPAHAVIHEIVAAYCSGGDHGIITASGELEPPPIADPSKETFARPVIASGAVDLGSLTVTDKPNAKFPEGTSVFAAVAGTSDHPSAEHCPKAP